MHTAESHISIGELFKAGIISAHLYNCLRKADFSSLSSIYEFVRKNGIMSFLKFENFGRKALSELEKLVNGRQTECRVSEIEMLTIAELTDETFRAHAEGHETILSVYPHSRAFCEGLAAMSGMPDYQGMGFQPETTVELWELTLLLLRQFALISDLSGYLRFYIHIQELRNTFESQFDRRRFFLKFDQAMLDPEMERLMANKYARVVGDASARVRELMEIYYPDCRTALERFFEGQSATARHSRCGKRHFSEVSHVLTSLYNFACALTQDASRGKGYLIMRYDYDFLRPDELAFAEAFHEEKGHLPMLFILYRHLLASEGRFESFYRKLYGIGCQPATLREISASANLSFERVRQILNGTELDHFRVDPIDWLPYKELFSKSVLSASDADCLAVRDEEGLGSLSFDCFGGLCALAGDYKRVTIGADSYFVKKNLMRLFNFKMSLKKVEGVRGRRSVADFSLPLSSFVAGCWRGRPSDEERAEVVQAFAGMLPLAFGIEARVADDVVLFPKNAISIEDELYSIILDNGEPMHIADIFREFKRRFSEHRFTEPYQLRPHLLLSNRIRAIGKSSKFSINKWTSVYTGTIRDLLHSILADSAKPMTVDELLAAISATFPRTNRNSVNSMLMGDSAKRFVKFRHGYFGLAGKDYGPQFVRSARTDHTRRSFEDHLEIFELFLEENGRAPVSNSENRREQSLLRWFKNVSLGRVSITEEQRRRLDAVVESNRHRMITGLEYTYLQKCRLYKEYVDENGVLPDQKDSPQLCGWFRRQLTVHKEFADKRRQFFQDLLAHIASAGLEPA